MTGFHASPVAGLNTEHIRGQVAAVQYSVQCTVQDRKGSGVNTNRKMLTRLIVVGGWWQPCFRSDGSILHERTMNNFNISRDI